MKTIREAIKFVQSIVPAVRTADTSGTAVDTLGFNTACLVVNVGDIDTASGDEQYTVNVEESADGSTSWTTVTGASLSITADNQIKSVEVPGLGVSRKRYLRAKLFVAGTTPSFPGSAVIALGNGYNQPVTQP